MSEDPAETFQRVQYRREETQRSTTSCPLTFPTKSENLEKSPSFTWTFFFLIGSRFFIIDIFFTMCQLTLQWLKLFYKAWEIMCVPIIGTQARVGVRSKFLIRRHDNHTHLVGIGEVMSIQWGYVNFKSLIYICINKIHPCEVL